MWKTGTMIKTYSHILFFVTPYVEYINNTKNPILFLFLLSFPVPIYKHIIYQGQGHTTPGE